MTKGRQKELIEFIPFEEWKPRQEGEDEIVVLVMWGEGYVWLHILVMRTETNLKGFIEEMEAADFRMESVGIPCPELEDVLRGEEESFEEIAREASAYLFSQVSQEEKNPYEGITEFFSKPRPDF